MWYYVDKERQQRGPITVDQLKALLQAGEITKRTHLWQEGRAEWTRLEDLAGTLGIALAAPPPTPPPTTAMARPMIQPIIAQPVQIPPAAPMSQPPVQAQPAAYPPVQAQSPYAVPPAAQLPFAVPSAQGPYGAQPAYPNVQAVYTPTQSKSGGCVKFVLGGIFLLLLALGLVLKYGKINFGVPSAKDRLADLVDEMQPARAAVEQVYKKTGSCPGEKNPLPETVQIGELGGYQYGALEDSGECILDINVPADYAIKELASTRIRFLYEKNERWLCGMSAAPELVPAQCEHFKQ